MPADLTERLSRGYAAMRAEVDARSASSGADVRAAGERRRSARRVAAGAVTGLAVAVAVIGVGSAQRAGAPAIPAAGVPSASTSLPAPRALPTRLLVDPGELAGLRPFGPLSNVSLAILRGGYPPCGAPDPTTSSAQVSAWYTGPRAALDIAVVEYPTADAAGRGFSTMRNGCDPAAYASRGGTSFVDGQEYPTLTTGGREGGTAVASALVGRRVVWLSLTATLTAREVGDGGAAENALLASLVPAIAQAR